MKIIIKRGITLGMSDNTGVIVRGEGGRFAKGTKTHAPITKENAHLLARKRWEKFRQTAASRIVREAAAIDPTIATPADAYGLLAAKQYTALLDYDKPRIDELVDMGILMTGHNPRQAAQDTDAATIAQGVSDGIAQALERIARDVRARHGLSGGGEVVDGSVEENGG